MLSIEVEYGYGNRAKGGRSLPMNVTFSGADEAIQGTAEILTRQSDGEIYAYRYPVSVAASGETTAHYVVPLGVGSSELAVRLLDEAGEVRAAKTVQLNISTASPELFVGILSDDPDALSYFNSASVNYGQMRTRAVTLESGTFPSYRTELDPMDVIVVSDYNISELNVEQTRALMQWMRDGGVLVLGTGDHADETLGVFAPEFLDDMYADPEETEIDLEENESMDTPGSSVVSLPIVDFTLHGGSTVLSADSVSLIQTAGKGQGVLAAASFDFVDLADYASSHSSFVDLMLTRVLGNTRLDDLASEAYGTEHEEYWSAQSLIDSGTPRLLPNPIVPGALLLLYVILAGPVLYLFLRSRKLSMHYRKAAAALGVLAAALAALITSGLRFRDTFYSYARIREAGEDTVNETTYLNLRNPYNGRYQAELAGDAEIKPLTAAEDRGKLAGVTGTETPDVVITETGDRKIISADNDTAFSSRFFLLRSEKENTDEEGFTGELSLFGDSLSGEITNSSPYTVTNAAVILYGEMIPLGTLDAGETVNIDEQILYHIPLNNTYTVAAFLCGVYDSTADRDAHLISLERANFLSFYLQSMNTGYQQDARVIGFAEEGRSSGGGSAGSGAPGSGKKAPGSGSDAQGSGSDASERGAGAPLIGAGLKNFGMTLSTSTASVDNRYGDEVSRSALSSAPEVLSGDYLYQTNSFYPGEPVVLNYSLGNDIRVKNVRIEEADPLFDGTEKEGASSFRGTISFYNYVTGGFDDIEPEKREFSSSELRQYLSPGNTLMVRYAETSGQTSDRLDMALPMLTVIGEEY